MNNTVLDTIIVGAGHAGLCASYYLKKANVRHVVFDKGKIADTWRTQRWDSFRMNTANKHNLLPDAPVNGHHLDAFGTHLAFVHSVEQYIDLFQLPVVEQAIVKSIEKTGNDNCFNVLVDVEGKDQTYQCRQVIIASGIQNKPKVPSFSHSISPEIKQWHSSQYKNPAQLPDGAVLVVGSGQSGCQIAEDLLDEHREVYLSTSLVPRIPRHYRGKDIVDWLMQLGFFNLKTEEVADPKILAMKVPQLTGIGNMGRTISLQYLAHKGATIVGKMENAEKDTAFFALNAPEHVRFADEFSKKAKDMIDGFIQKNGLTAPQADVDEADCPDNETTCATLLPELSFRQRHITSIIWATGFAPDFQYIHLPVFDNNGYPVHNNGISFIKGLYFLGFPWLRNRKSGLLAGIKEDAAFIAGKIAEAL